MSEPGSIDAVDLHNVLITDYWQPLWSLPTALQTEVFHASRHFTLEIATFLDQNPDVEIRNRDELRWYRVPEHLEEGLLDKFDTFVKHDIYVDETMVTMQDCNAIFETLDPHSRVNRTILNNTRKLYDKTRSEWRAMKAVAKQGDITEPLVVRCVVIEIPNVMQFPDFVHDIHPDLLADMFKKRLDMLLRKEWKQYGHNFHWLDDVYFPKSHYRVEDYYKAYDDEEQEAWVEMPFWTDMDQPAW